MPLGGVKSPELVRCRLGGFSKKKLLRLLADGPSPPWEPD